MRSPTSHARRIGLPLGAAALVVAATALPASAHVQVTSPDATPGGEGGTLVFRVPSESDSARTTKVSISLPTKTPFAFVSSKPVPGWSVSTTEQKLAEPVKAEGFTLTKAVASVTWTAQSGQGLSPGQFDEFELSVGPLPKGVDSIEMPTTQTYSDGEVVRWDQPTPASGEEPEHPVPTLALTAAKASDTATASHEHGGTTTAAAAAVSDSDSTARWLGGAGLVLGAAALVVALLRRRGATAGPVA